MTLTKGVAAFCGALLILLLGGWVGELIYHPGHGDHHEQAYVIDTGEGEGEAEVEEEPVDFAVLMASADPAKGERAFSKCKACHKLEDGANGTGPHLYSLVGREIGGVDGYSYSAALADAPGAWTPEELYAWLADPTAYAPGTKMALKTGKSEDRVNLIAYLETIGG
jgi:cytochrome c